MASPVIWATFVSAYCPRNATVWLAVLTALPVTRTSPGLMLDSASSAACVTAFVALKAIGAVV